MIRRNLLSSNVINFEEKLRWRQACERSISNFLWFIRFERSFAKEAGQEVSDELTQMEKDILWELNRRKEPWVEEIKRVHYGV